MAHRMPRRWRWMFWWVLGACLVSFTPLHGLWWLTASGAVVLVAAFVYLETSVGLPIDR